MALIFCDGWDKYGGLNSVSANVAALLTAGEWTSTSGGGLAIVAPLSVNGLALQFTNATTITKTLASNYSRLIGGFRFSSALLALGGIGLNDGGANQCGITINTTGNIVLRNGNAFTGTILATSTVSVTANSVHYLEFDISFGNSSTVVIYLDGVAVIGGSSGVNGNSLDTTATANNFANGITLGGTSTCIIAIDDFYLLDTTGPAPLNAPLLTSPRIETQFPSSDGVVQFAVGASILGSSTPRSTPTSSGASTWRVHAYTPPRACTLNSIAFLPAITNATPQFRPIVYADSAGAPGSLLGSGSTVVGMTANVPVVMPLSTPLSLSAGTQYWIGMMNDVTTGGSSLNSLDGTSSDRTGTATFASGAPGTPPASLSNSVNVCMWGIITGLGVNYPQVANNPPQGINAYVYDATVGHEDLYNFPALSVTPSSIYAVAVKGNIAKSDAGAKTVSLRTKSSSVDSAGGGGTSLVPTASYTWLTSLFNTDPNTSAAWTLSALNAAQAGLRVES